MIGNSRGRRRIAALATGALAAGVLTVVPGIAGLSAASAASASNVAYTCDITMSGSFASYGGQKAATLTLDTDAPSTLHLGETSDPALTYTLTLDPAFAAQFGPSPIRWMQSTLTGATKTGAATGTTGAIKSAVWERGGGIDSAVPAFTLTGSGSWGEIAPTATGTLPLSVGTMTGTLAMATWFGNPPNPPAPMAFSPITTYPMTCTPDSGTDTTVDTLAVALPDTSNYTCDVQLTGGQAAYGGQKRVTVALSTTAPTTMETGETVSPTVTGTLTFDDTFASQFGPSPVNRVRVDLDADTTTGATVDTIDVVSTVWQRGGGIGSPVPKMTLDLSGTWDAISPTSAGDLNLAIGDMVGTISMGTTFSPTMTSYGLDCVADVPLDLDTIEVTQTALPQSIDFPAPAAQRLGNGPFTLSATADSGLLVAFGSQTPTVCTVQDATATLVSAGTCTIDATQPGDATHQAATPVTRNFTVAPAQVPAGLTLTGPAGAALSAGTVTLGQTSTSTGAVTLTSLTPKVCVVGSQRTVRLLNGGTCTVRATQAGDANHLAPAPATASFAVWATPVVAARGYTAQLVQVLGRGESALKVRTSTAGQCRAEGASVLLLDAGTCRVSVVDAKGRTVRSAHVTVAYPKGRLATSSAKRAATVYFAYNSAKLTDAAKRSLRARAPSMRGAKAILVYGNTYGAGKNSAASRKLARDRAKAVVAYLRTRGVKAQAISIAAAAQNPVSKNPAKNRRAEVYVLR